MVVNDKSDILRSFHNDATGRRQESHELNELAAQHSQEGCQPSQNIQCAVLQKLPKLVARKEREKTPDI